MIDLPFLRFNQLTCFGCKTPARPFARYYVSRSYAKLTKVYWCRLFLYICTNIHTWMSYWRPAESVSGISSHPHGLFCGRSGREGGEGCCPAAEKRLASLLASAKVRKQMNGTVPTARWCESSRLRCPYPLCDRSLCFYVAVGPRPGSTGPLAAASQPVPLSVTSQQR